MSLALITQYTEELVKDEDERLNPADFASAIRAAVNKFSRLKPKIAVIDVVGNDLKIMPLPEEWDEGFSKIIEVEYPLNEFPPAHLMSDLYMVYQSPEGEKLFTKDNFATTDTLRLSISVAYTVDAAKCDIHKTYFDIVSLWAAARCLDELSTIYSGDGDVTINADSVDHNGRAREYSNRARNLRKQFYDDLGVDPKRNIAAGAVVDLNQSTSHGKGNLQPRRRGR